MIRQAIVVDTNIIFRALRALTLELNCLFWTYQPIKKGLRAKSFDSFFEIEN